MRRSVQISQVARGTVLAFAAVMALGGLPAFAHHSFAMFDLARTQTLTGVVK